MLVKSILSIVKEYIFPWLTWNYRFTFSRINWIIVSAGHGFKGKPNILLNLEEQAMKVSLSERIKQLTALWCLLRLLGSSFWWSTHTVIANCCSAPSSWKVEIFLAAITCVPLVWSQPRQHVWIPLLIDCLVQKDKSNVTFAREACPHCWLSYCWILTFWDFICNAHNCVN